MSEASSESFVCAVCGESHSGLPTDHGWKLPDDVWAIPEAERQNHAKFDSDLCKYGDRFFIRAILKVSMLESGGYFGWGMWVEVGRASFERYLALYDQDGSAEPRHEGRLANVPPPYPEIRDAPVLLQFSTSTQRPEIHFPDDADTLLAVEQRNGMDNRRYHEILGYPGM